ncbi:Acyl carrier protein phosphodiesterase [Stanieria cyanosphaera PCC 7437]|uniref:Acyl carrier protein phosphodiesterase n=1 Tax=Stanieria cyanosphaera (strain ATCC 29371 / PCC 7437) TaxID=111780 RepID=K9XRK7_STAC7|nr:ACP phosphodiesterase [Stanieria cyanosphaera]AFZ35148.1 Acyl carrier protein phosphodiesterase [Stanieria cyanosphaera PCC 7437]
MNWLAHLLLAKPDIESRLGNLLGDLVKGRERQNLPKQFQLGLQCHQAIDCYTDNHWIVKRSKQRIQANYGRFAGILVDVFYDYILAQNWYNYSALSLSDFTIQVYSSFTHYLAQVPPRASLVINKMIEEDWLGSYQTWLGIEHTLQRISWRITRRTNCYCNLTPALNEFRQQYFEFEQDFGEFFPQLTRHIQNWNLSH